MSTMTEVSPRPFAPPPAGRLVKVELRKMVDTRSGRWLLGIAAIITIGVAILLGFLATGSDADLEPLLEVTWLPLSIFLSVIGILSATGEWSQRTALTTFALVPQRQRVVAAKLWAAVLLGVIAIAVSFLAAAIGTAISGGSWHLNVAHFGDGLLLLELSVLTGVGFGLVLMSPSLAIVVSFVLPTAFAILGEIKSLKSTWHWLDPSSTQGALSNADAHGSDWSKLLVSTLIWTVVPIVAGIVRTMRHEAK